MKICLKCGHENADETASCTRCGQSEFRNIAATTPMQLPASGLAITSLVLGIISTVAFFMCGGIIGIPAVICGHIALSRANRFPERYGGRGLAIAGLATGYVGIVITLVIMPAMLLPALARAKEKAQEIVCVNNLKQIGTAVRVWANDHNDTLPQNFMQVTNYLGSPICLICPVDPQHKRPAGGSGWDPANISYELLTPGMSLEEVKNKVIVRCPFHSNELMGDGTVRTLSRRSVNNK
jgi:ribosomal protein L40E